VPVPLGQQQGEGYGQADDDHGEPGKQEDGEGDQEAAHHSYRMLMDPASNVSVDTTLRRSSVPVSVFDPADEKQASVARSITVLPDATHTFPSRLVNVMVPCIVSPAAVKPAQINPPVLGVIVALSSPADK